MKIKKKEPVAKLTLSYWVEFLARGRELKMSGGARQSMEGVAFS